jgi:hypothetical protein
MNMPSTPETGTDSNKEELTQADLTKEMNKIQGPLGALDIVYFFDLMMSKNFRYLMKEPISHMFYDNIFIHNSGRF